MLFNSLDFAVFLCLVLGVVAALPHRAQNRFLLLASYAFYAAWDWRFLALIALSTGVDYAVSHALEKTDDRGKRRRLLAVSATVNLGILGFFKYFNFFAESGAGFLQWLGIPVGDVTLTIVLPVGISFFTFQTMSYTIDAYWRRLEPVKSFTDFALFVAFFPQLVAGPIERADRHLIPQITRPSAQAYAGGREVLAPAAFGLILSGLSSRRPVIADQLASVVDQVF